MAADPLLQTILFLENRCASRQSSIHEIFMREGHFARHIGRMRVLYGQRRTSLVDCLHKEFGSTLEILGAEAGMHLVVILPKRLRDTEIANKAAREKLWLWPLSPSYLGDTSRQGFILGFGNTTVEEMPRAVGRLRAVMADGKKASTERS